MGLIAHYEAHKSRLWIAGFILVAVHQGRYFQLIINDRPSALTLASFGMAWTMSLRDSPGVRGRRK